MSSTAQSLPIEVSSLCKAYGSVKALDNVSLNIAAGEFLWHGHRMDHTGVSLQASIKGHDDPILHRFHSSTFVWEPIPNET